jgi:transketolase
MPSRQDSANAIRALAMDAVERANSGHPGMPMGMADIAEVLWRDYLRHNPANPDWPDRDRFIVSNGHGSMLLYAALHLSGYDLPIGELKNFRQLGSKTPGHPEYGVTPGVETTTGPLGQGLANAVGMALAQRVLAARFNRGGHTPIDHYTYVFTGDGCLMEGLSHEACSLAGTLKLGRLIAFYDDNGISIDGRVEGWFTDDTPGRFEAYGWHVLREVDGHDSEAVRAAIESARTETARPTLICCKTVIGRGAPNKQGGEGIHGAALGEDEIAAARAQLGWTAPPFEIPDEIYVAWDARERGAELERDWAARMRVYADAYPELASELNRRLRRELPGDWDEVVSGYVARIQAGGKPTATRKASQAVLDNIGPALPGLIGGSADLSGSNNTRWDGAKAITPDDFDGNYVYYGVREFAMTAILNGLSLHGGFVAFGGTFLTFSDYARNAVRLAALMGAPSILVYTHDSIGLGEDGPTHQPVEHLASLRLIPGLEVWRPCDSVETAVAWRRAVERGAGPTVLALSRQSMAHQGRDNAQLANIARGGYVLWEPDGEPEALIIATGSEVELAVGAARALVGQRAVRVVSMPCTQVFDAQEAAYRESVLPGHITARVAVEAGVTECWQRYVGDGGAVLGINQFGESAPAGDVFAHLRLTSDRVQEAVLAVLGGAPKHERKQGGAYVI